MFKTMTACLDPKKCPKDEDIKKIPSYVFCRWLSGHRGTILAANQINYYYDIPIENQFHLVRNAFAGKLKYIPYPKNVSADKLKEIEYISAHFNISEEKAKEYLELISEEELKGIVDMYIELEKKGKK